MRFPLKMHFKCTLKDHMALFKRNANDFQPIWFYMEKPWGYFHEKTASSLPENKQTINAT
nr:hypothetical protein BCU47_09080 [Enterovibrio norvegicus]